jgi:hypothetical protein
MLRNLRVPLLRAQPVAIPCTFRRSLAVGSTGTHADPASSLSPNDGAWAAFLDKEPKGPNVITEIPGPKARAAKEAMGKIQDVFRLE